MDVHPNSDDPHQRPRYVGFWLRMVAFIIDSVLISFLVMPLLYALGTTGNLNELIALYHADNIYSLLDALVALDSQTAGRGGILGSLINFVLPAIAIIVFWIYKSATPGKMVVGAAIVDAKTLGKPSPGQLIGRYAGYYVSTLGLLLGFVWIAFDEHKQGWHDKLAGTVVIRTRG